MTIFKTIFNVIDFELNVLKVISIRPNIGSYSKNKTVCLNFIKKGE